MLSIFVMYLVYADKILRYKDEGKITMDRYTNYWFLYPYY